MNQSVSRIDHNVRSFRSVAFVLGLVQGGEFVTARATVTVKGPFRYSTLRPIPQLATREVKGLEIQHPRRRVDFFPEIR